VDRAAASRIAHGDLTLYTPGGRETLGFALVLPRRPEPPA
jgi:hypothetical protein